MTGPAENSDPVRSSADDTVRIARGRAIVSGLMFAAGLVFVAASLKLDRGDMAHPGPGLYPLVLGVLAAVAGIAGWLEARGTEARFSVESSGSSLRPWGFIAAMTAGAIALPTLGYLVSAFITGTAVSWVAGQRTWWKALLTGLAIAVVSSLLLRRALDVYLPASMIDELL